MLAWGRGDMGMEEEGSEVLMGWMKRVGLVWFGLFRFRKYIPHSVLDIV